MRLHERLERRAVGVSSRESSAPSRDEALAPDESLEPAASRICPPDNPGEPLLCRRLTTAIGCSLPPNSAVCSSGRIRIEKVSYYRLGYLHIVRPGHAAIEKVAEPDPRALLAVTATVSVRRRSIFWRICCTPAPASIAVAVRLNDGRTIRC
jgi:hypothetical protein